MNSKYKQSNTAQQRYSSPKPGNSSKTNGRSGQRGEQELIMKAELSRSNRKEARIIQKSLKTSWEENIAEKEEEQRKYELLLLHSE